MPGTDRGSLVERFMHQHARDAPLPLPAGSTVLCGFPWGIRTRSPPSLSPIVLADSF